MTLSIETFPAGALETNAYLVVDTETQTALVIDAPPESVAVVQEAVSRLGVTVQQVVLTHGHWDHIVDTAAMAQAFGVPVVGHAAVVDRVTSPQAAPVPIPAATVDHLLDDGDEVTLGAHRFAIWHLPGHDEAHIVLISVDDGVMLGGDVLFPGGHGRTDIPGSDQATMERSLARLLELPDTVVVYPGHGAPTTIGQERGWMSAMTLG